MDTRMFSVAAHNSDEIERMRVALARLPGVQDVMVRKLQGDIVVTFDNEQVKLFEIIGACRPQFTITDSWTVRPGQGMKA